MLYLTVAGPAGVGHVRGRYSGGRHERLPAAATQTPAARTQTGQDAL